MTFDSLDGLGLEEGDLRFYFTHKERPNPILEGSLLGCLEFFSRPGPASCSPPSPENSDVLEATLRLQIRNEIVLSTLTYGISDRFDVGVIVPFVTTTLNAKVDERILRLGTAADPTVHSFDGLGADRRSRSDGGTASGLGDIGVTLKYNVLQRDWGALSVFGDVRFPTGDVDNLLGSGTIRVKGSGLFTTGSRDFSPHVNLGVSLGSEFADTLSIVVPEARDEFNYTVGFDWAVVDRATVSVDVLGRMDLYGNNSGFALADTNLEFVSAPGADTQTFAVQQLQGFGGPQSIRHIAQGVIGAKFNPFGTLLVPVNILFPITSTGLRNKPAVQLGLQYTF